MTKDESKRLKLIEEELAYLRKTIEEANARPIEVHYHYYYDYDTILPILTKYTDLENQDGE